MKKYYLIILITCSIFTKALSQKYYSASQVTLVGDHEFHRDDARTTDAKIFITPEEDEVIITTKEKSTDYKNINYNLTFFNIAYGHVTPNRYVVKGNPKIIQYSPTKDTLYVMTDAGLSLIKINVNETFFLNVQVSGWDLFQMNKDELAVVKNEKEVVKLSLMDYSIQPISDIRERDLYVNKYYKQYRRDTICTIGYNWNGNDIMICNRDGSECAQIPRPSGFGSNAVAYSPSHEFVVYITNTSGYYGYTTYNIAYFNIDEKIEPVSSFKYSIDLRRIDFNRNFQKDFNEALDNNYGVYASLFKPELNPLNNMVVGPDKSKPIAEVKLLNANDTECTFSVFNYTKGGSRWELKDHNYISNVTPRIFDAFHNEVDKSKNVATYYFETKPYHQIKSTITILPKEPEVKRDQLEQIVHDSYLKNDDQSSKEEEAKEENEDSEWADILNRHIEIKDLKGETIDNLNLNVDFSACGSHYGFDFFMEMFNKKVLEQYTYFQNLIPKAKPDSKKIDIVINGYTFSDVSQVIVNTTYYGVQCTIEGTIDGKTFTSKGGNIYNKQNKDSAISGAVSNLEGILWSQFLQKFPIPTSILSFEDFSSSNVKKVSVRDDNNYGLIPYFELNVFKDKNSTTPLAVLKVISNDFEKAICKVESGGKELIKYKDSLSSLYVITKY